MKTELHFILVAQKMEDSMLLCAMLLKAGYEKNKMTSVYSWSEGVERLTDSNGACLMFVDKNSMKSEPEYSNLIQKQALVMPIILVEDVEDNQTNTDIIELGVQEVISLRELTSNYLGKAVQHAVERHHMRQQIRETAMFDTLTGLYNRHGFLQRAEQALCMAQRMDMNVVVFFMDVDYMKWVNDSLGHQEGDILLMETANILRAVVRKTDIVGRVGGDEFAVLILRQQAGIGERMIARLQETLNKYNGNRKISYPLSLSVGQAECLKGQTIDLQELLARADEKMYENKKTKRGQAPASLL